MTWKTYAAVSGATVLAGWLASSPPPNSPAPAAARVQRTPQTAARATNAEADIEEQAARLQAKMRSEPVFNEPARNPFRFGNSAPVGSAPADRVDEAPPAAIEPVEPPAPLPPPIRLSGVAEDRNGDRVERTAVLSTPAGVLLVREGDMVMDQYRVSRIDAEAVELTDASGGASLRLTLRP
jgi:hypothetical protein